MTVEYSGGTYFGNGYCTIHGQYMRTDGYSGCPWCYPGAHTIPTTTFVAPASPTMYPHLCPVCNGTMCVLLGFYPDGPEETTCRACTKGVIYTV